MLRDLTMDEMKAVAGGQDEEDEVVATGVRRHDPGVTTISQQELVQRFGVGGTAYGSTGSVYSPYGDNIVRNGDGSLTNLTTGTNVGITPPSNPEPPTVEDPTCVIVPTVDVKFRGRRRPPEIRPDGGFVTICI